jgi:hypothetical protein
MPAVETTFTLTSVLSEAPLRVCFSALDVGRALYLYIGLGEAPAALGSLYAAVPGGGGSGAPAAAGSRPLPASSTQLLDGDQPTVDETEADFFSALLSARTGKLVLLSFNASSDLVDATGVQEIKKRALAFVDGLAAAGEGAHPAPAAGQ